MPGIPRTSARSFSRSSTSASSASSSTGSLRRPHPSSRAAPPPTENHMTSYLQIDHLSKTFTRGAQATEVLHDITLTIEQGDYVSIIGHSGCGKSTLLNIVAGSSPYPTPGGGRAGREGGETGPPRAAGVLQHHPP